jgi:hypothetical protein
MNGTVLPGGPVKENCTVILKVLPKAFELGLLYHPAKAAVRGTVTSKVGGCVFVGNVNWNSALVMSRGVERPVTTMLKPVRVMAQGTTLVMTGTVGLTVMTLVTGTGVSELPAESMALVVIVMVPATVPIITGTLAAGTAGERTKVVVVPPMANFASNT